MAPHLSMKMFHRKSRSADTPGNGRSKRSRKSEHNDTTGLDSDFSSAMVEYYIQSSPHAELDGFSYGEQKHLLHHNCDYIEVNQCCNALQGPIPGFLVNLFVQDPVRGQTIQQPMPLISPCWKRVEDAVRDVTFLMHCPASGNLVEARPGSFYKVSIAVPEAVIPQLTSVADQDWGTILSVYATQGDNLGLDILVERCSDYVC